MDPSGVRLALEEMKSLGLSMEVAEAVGRLWEVIIRDEGAESDFTAAIKPIEKAAGVVVGGSPVGLLSGRAARAAAPGKDTSSSWTGVPAGRMPSLRPGQRGSCSSRGPPRRKVVAGLASRCTRTQEIASQRG